MTTSSTTDRPTQPAHEGLGHLVPADAGERLPYAGMELVIRASAESTGGAFCLIEEIDPVDVPLHVHEDHDELWFVLEGRHVFTIGDKEFAAGPGDVVFGPRGVPHAHVVPETGRGLVMVSPAGFEGFFRDLSAADQRGEADVETLVRIADDYNVTMLG